MKTVLRILLGLQIIFIFFVLKEEFVCFEGRLVELALL